MSEASKKKKSVKKSNLANDISTIYRHSEPTKYDLHPEGTKCVVRNEELYIQTSQDDNIPCWVLVGPYTPPKQP